MGAYGTLIFQNYRQFKIDRSFEKQETSRRVHQGRLRRASGNGGGGEKTR